MLEIVVWSFKPPYLCRYSVAIEKMANTWVNQTKVECVCDEQLLEVNGNIIYCDLVLCTHWRITCNNKAHVNWINLTCEPSRKFYWINVTVKPDFGIIAICSCLRVLCGTLDRTIKWSLLLEAKLTPTRLRNQGVNIWS